jgi:hypothetical protein
MPPAAPLTKKRTFLEPEGSYTRSSWSGVVRVDHSEVLRGQAMPTGLVPTGRTLPVLATVQGLVGVDTLGHDDQL